MGSTFFGLTINIAPIFRKSLFSQIHQILFHGKGGYDYNSVYNMPIWLRKYTFSEIDKFYKNEKDEYDKAKSGGKGTKNMVDAGGKVNTPAFAQESKAYKGKTSYK